MSAHAKLEALLAELAPQLGFPALELDAGGVCSLAFDQRFIVNVASRPERGQVVLFASLGSPVAPRMACFMAMLRAGDEGGVVVALDEANDQLIATAHAPVETLDVSGLVAWLMRFAEAVESLRDALA